MLNRVKWEDVVNDMGYSLLSTTVSTNYRFTCLWSTGLLFEVGQLQDNFITQRKDIYICLNKCTFSADNTLKTAKLTWQYTALNKRILLLAKRTTFYEQSTNIEKKREITFKPMLEKGYNHSLHRIHTCHHGKEILVNEQWFSIHLWWASFPAVVFSM